MIIRASGKSKYLRRTASATEEKAMEKEKKKEKEKEKEDDMDVDPQPEYALSSSLRLVDKLVYNLVSCFPNQHQTLLVDLVG